MPRPVLIGIGGPVVGALVGQLGAVPGLAERVALHLAPESPHGRARADPAALAAAVVALEEDGAMDAAERATLPPGCAVITLPRMEFISLWPEAGIATGSPARLDQWHEASARALFRREAGCDIRIAAFVLSRFRHERLFHSATRPAGPLLLHMLAQLLGHPALLALTAQPYDLALRAVAGGLATIFAEARVPVHPAVAAHFALNWWSPAE
ncbi:MAG: hypothetical protein IT555_18680, partial [Acetobacteraceae bacterium]|nr:hypothetical protein [Acetobacteraceae bacterium]